MQLSFSTTSLTVQASLFTEEAAKKQKLHTQHFKGSVDEVLIAIINNKKHFLCGLGKETELTEERVRRAAAHLIKAAKEQKVAEFSISFSCNLAKEKVITAVSEGLLLANHPFDKYHQESREKRIKKIYINDSSKFNKQISKAKLICTNVLLARDILNDSPSEMNADAMETLAKKVAKQVKLKLTILNKDSLEKKGLNLITAVGRGAQHAPRLIIMEYKGNPKTQKRIALVGKGITFDSGGVNLKPTGYIEDMKMDKAGAVTVLATMKSIAELKLKLNVVAFMPFCENAISHKAYKPGDIITSYSGRTVEITNTDAEGRLVLADAITYAVKHYKPTHIVDVATLTGAALSALGEFVAPIFSNNDTLSQQLFDAGEQVHERLWRFPLYEDFEKDNPSRLADLQNAPKTRYYGSISGALFLKPFVEKTPWVHIDMAGTAASKKPRWYLQEGCTGWGVRLLVRFLENFKQ